MGLNTYNLSRNRFVVDESSLERLPGVQIDWTTVTAGVDGQKRLQPGTVLSRQASGKAQPRAYKLTLTNVAVASNVATATKTNHGFVEGEQIFIEGADLAYVNGLKTIATVPDADTFTFTATGSNATASGTITAARVATEILETEANENQSVAALSGYGTLVGGVLFENLLPDATSSPKKLPAQYKEELKSAGCTFKFHQYADSRA